MARRIVTINLSLLRDSGLTIDRLMDYLSKASRTETTKIRIAGDKLIIEFIGSKASIRESIARLKLVLSEVLVKRVGKDLHFYSLRRIYREVGLAIPPDVLAEILRRQGYKVERVSDGIATNASIDVVVELGSAIAHVFKQLEQEPLTTGARKALAAAAVATGLQPSSLLSLGLNHNILVEDNRGRIAIRGSWIESYKRLVDEAESGV